MKAAALRVAVLGDARSPRTDALLCVLDGDRVAALLDRRAGDHFESESTALRRAARDHDGPVFCVVTRWHQVAERGTAADVSRALSAIPGFAAVCREPLVIPWEGAVFGVETGGVAPAPAGPSPASLRALLVAGASAVAAGRTWRQVPAWLMTRVGTAERARRVLRCPALPAEVLELLVGIAADHVRDRVVDPEVARARREDFRHVLRACRTRWTKSG
ncbi:hypothetical protein ACFYOT_33515 [Saccharothrix saharensis]|uniref:hypothetical protein n=1 Tax=Saccharothrix saharensis TaxID=571190 RepID=UPI0036BFDBE7